MNYRHSLIDLAMAAVVDSVLAGLTSTTEAGHGGLLYAFEISGDRSKRRVTHAWVVAPFKSFKISVPCLRHRRKDFVKEQVKECTIPSIRRVYIIHCPEDPQWTPEGLEALQSDKHSMVDIMTYCGYSADLPDSGKRVSHSGPAKTDKP